MGFKQLLSFTNDLEKTRHSIVFTLDVRQQIIIMNRKGREEWEKKQAETEKLWEINDGSSTSWNSIGSY